MSDERTHALWEGKYQAGHRERYPWDVVVSFLFRHAPSRPRADVHVLEVGFGTANNLWCAAREGFAVSGVEHSATAVDMALARFADERLVGDLRCGDFTALPFASDRFELAIDRAAITCASSADAARAVHELRRVLRPGGRLLSCLYSSRCTSAASGTLHADGRRHDISVGSLTGVGPLRFYKEEDVRQLFAGWTVHQLQHVERRDVVAAEPVVHAEWVVIAEKPQAIA